MEGKEQQDLQSITFFPSLLFSLLFCLLTYLSSDFIHTGYIKPFLKALQTLKYNSISRWGKYFTHWSSTGQSKPTWILPLLTAFPLEKGIKIKYKDKLLFVDTLQFSSIFFLLYNDHLYIQETAYPNSRYRHLLILVSTQWIQHKSLTRSPIANWRHFW